MAFIVMKQHRLKLVIEVMATNLRDRIDEAIQSRVGESVQFSYPTFAQCKEHFAANASLVSQFCIATAPAILAHFQHFALFAPAQQ